MTTLNYIENAILSRKTEFTNHTRGSEELRLWKYQLNYTFLKLNRLADNAVNVRDVWVWFSLRQSFLKLIGAYYSLRDSLGGEGFYLRYALEACILALDLAIHDTSWLNWAHLIEKLSTTLTDTELGWEDITKTAEEASKKENPDFDKNYFFPYRILKRLKESIRLSKDITNDLTYFLELVENSSKIYGNLFLHPTASSLRHYLDYTYNRLIAAYSREDDLDRLVYLSNQIRYIGNCAKNVERQLPLPLLLPTSQ